MLIAAGGHVASSLPSSNAMFVLSQVNHGSWNFLSVVCVNLQAEAGSGSVHWLLWPNSIGDCCTVRQLVPAPPPDVQVVLQEAVVIGRICKLQCFTDLSRKSMVQGMRACALSAVRSFQSLVDQF